MADKAQYFKGYTALSDRVYLLEPSQHEVSQQDISASAAIEPTTIIIFTWGNGHPKHITKYVSGYRQLYPTSRIIVVLCTLFESMFETIDKHTRAMQPVVDALFPKNKTENAQPERLLVQIMSNSGAVSFIATLLAYKATRISMGEANPAPLPHTLLVCDSVPGSMTFWPGVLRRAQGLTQATGDSTPLPAIVLVAYWLVYLTAKIGFSWVTGLEKVQIGNTLPGAIQDPNVMSNSAARLYLYSKNDILIPVPDVERHIAAVIKRGYVCRTEKFDASTHVGHMRMYSDKYWGAIAKSWESAVTKEQTHSAGK